MAASPPIAQNRRARREYFIEDKFEAGVVLVGSEVKSLRLGRASINEAYAGEEHGQLVLFNSHIAEYEPANRMNHAPRRVRRLLVHRRERDRLLGLIRRDGATLVPLTLYFNERGIAKIELGVARGKRKADKRESERKRDWQREKARVLRARN